MLLKDRAADLCKRAVNYCLPDEAVKRALKDQKYGSGKIIVVAVGKASWEMAKATQEFLGDKIDKGLVVTKHGHSKGDIPGFEIMEASHPVVDETSVAGAERALEVVSGLSADDTVLFMLSGGGSALFEKPLIPLEEMADINKQLLACGADIVEINTVRKRLSGVKGGRFALACAPAQIYSLMLSDVVGDNPGMIASGPAYPDTSTCEEALEIVEKYGIKMSKAAEELMHKETPKELPNAHSVMTGGVAILCDYAAKECAKDGYEPVILTDSLDCVAREAGWFLAACARYQSGKGKKIALIAGGETIVHLTGKGLGGRNQEFALAAAEKIAGYDNIGIACMGSDGTDGPCDAAGGRVDGSTKDCLAKQGVKIYEVLRENDAYHALEKCDGLIMTGGTGTNVNDVAIALIDG